VEFETASSFDLKQRPTGREESATVPALPNSGLVHSNYNPITPLTLSCTATSLLPFPRQLLLSIASFVHCRSLVLSWLISLKLLPGLHLLCHNATVACGHTFCVERLTRFGVICCKSVSGTLTRKQNVRRPAWDREDGDVSNNRVPSGEAGAGQDACVRALQHCGRPADREDQQDGGEGSSCGCQGSSIASLAQLLRPISPLFAMVCGMCCVLASRFQGSSIACQSPLHSGSLAGFFSGAERVAGLSVCQGLGV
jgi:hypothetical protein